MGSGPISQSPPQENEWVLQGLSGSQWLGEWFGRGWVSLRQHQSTIIKHRSCRNDFKGEGYVLAFLPLDRRISQSPTSSSPTPHSHLTTCHLLHSFFLFPYLAGMGSRFNCSNRRSKPFKLLQSLLAMIYLISLSSD